MDQEFSIEKQDFTIIKEKIIKTNELLVLYNEKNEKLTKATQAFKQLKGKYETVMHETNRLKIENERLNYTLETIKPKYEQNEKDLLELRSDYSRVGERYQQTMIESQLTISDLEEKVKDCTCEKLLCLSPSKKRTPIEKVKELKEICKELKDVECNLKNANEHLQLKNKELKEENLRKLKVIDDFKTKNADLQRDLVEVKTKLQKMELISKDQANLQLTISSLKQNHEKEIHSLKMNISKLSHDNQRIKYLELECKHLKDQINSTKVKTEKSDFCVQTEESLENNRDSICDSTNMEKIKILKLKCRKLKKKLTDFENRGVLRQDIGIQTEIIELNQTLNENEDDFLDFDCSVSNIFSEMILPKALSPFNFSPRSSESPAPPGLDILEPILPFDDELSQEPYQQKTLLQNSIPDIVITPPTPSVEKGNNANVMFPLLTENSEKDKPQKRDVNISNPVIKEENRTVLKEEIISTSEIQSFKMEELSLNEMADPIHKQPVSPLEITNIEGSWTSTSESLVSVNYEKKITDKRIVEEFKHSSSNDKSVGLEHEALTAEVLDNNSSKVDKLATNNVYSFDASTNENIGQEYCLEKKVSSEEKGVNTAPRSLISTCDKSVSTEKDDLSLLNNISGSVSENSKIATVNHQNSSLDLTHMLQQRRRKFWIPYNTNEFLKTRKKHNPIKIAKVTKRYREFPSKQSAQHDTILEALRTLQKHNINFTISNESLPLVQPYNCYSLISPPKAEPRPVPRKFKDTFICSLDCWNKKCTTVNTRMLLRKVPNEEEPELLGFFSVKDEVVTPAASRMAVIDNRKSLDPQDIIAKLLSGIQELVDVKRKESSRNRRKKQPKSTTRRSDFYSETETELEKLFRNSADVLGRNKRFLAEAKQQHFESTTESLFESETEVKVDSGLVTGTPKIETDSLGFFSQYDACDGAVPDILSPIIKNFQSATGDVSQVHSKETTTLPQKTENSELSTSTFSRNVQKSPDHFENKTSSVLSNCTTPKFSTCPDMLSPIASSKGSPETFQGLSTPLKTPEVNTNSESSLDCFKIPFCPIMISPMAPSSKGSPPSQTSNTTNIKDLSEDSPDSFKTSLLPIMVSPLNSFSRISSENNANTKETTESNNMTDEGSARIENEVSIEIDKPTSKSISSENDLHISKEPNAIEILDENKDPTKNSYNIKLINEKIKALINQKITLEFFKNNGQVDQCDSPKSFHEQALGNSMTDNNEKLNYVEKTTDIKDDKANNPDLEKSETIESNENKLDTSARTDESSSLLNLSIKSADLNCTLDHMNISQLEPCLTTMNDLDELPASDIHLKTNCSGSKNRKDKPCNETPNVEGRYFLRRKSQCKAKEDDEFVRDFTEIDSLLKGNTADFILPRSRASKRKLDKQVNIKADSDIGTISGVPNTQEPEETVQPVKKKRGRSRKGDKILVTSENTNISNISLDISDVKKCNQEDDKEVENHKEQSNNEKELTCNNLFESVFESGSVISSKNNNFKSDIVRVDKNIMEEERVEFKKEREKHRRESRNFNQSISDLELENNTSSEECVKNSEQQDQNLVNAEKKEIMTAKDFTDKSNFDKIRNVRRSRKAISKEFISESESECDISPKDHVETSQQSQVSLDDKINKICYDTETNSNSRLELCDKDLSQKSIKNDSFNHISNYQNLTDEKMLLHASLEHTGLKKKKEIMAGSDSDSNTTVKSNFSSIQEMTSSIQNVLRNLSEETAETTNKFLVKGSNRSQKDVNVQALANSENCNPSEIDLFGDVSESEEEACNSKEVTPKTIPKKVAVKKKQNLKKKMLNQVRGMVYAYGTNKSCDEKKSCENNIAEVSTMKIPEVSSSKSLGSSVKEKKDGKKIKIVQNILISKGQTFNLLPKDSKSGSSISTSSSQIIDDLISPPPTVNKEKCVRTYQRKNEKSEKNISNNSTPVDILSQVMQGMIKTGPKAQVKKNVSYHYNFATSGQVRQPIFNNGTEQKNIQNTTRKQWRKPADNKTEEVNADIEPLESPRSPDVMELPDRLPKLIPTEKPVKLAASKVRVLMDKLMVFSNEAKMLDEVIREFAFQDMTFLVQIILDKLSQDVYDKADNLLPPSPPMTSTQRILLGFLLKLDRSTHPGIQDKFLSQVEMHLFHKACKIETVQPLTRLYTALCKAKYDLNRIRRFICDGFYFMGDFSIPMFFTVLTMWPEVLPLASESSDHLLARTIVQICYLKECNQPGYNLMPLRDLLNKFFGYPTERWNCEEIFKEIIVQYIRNPSIRLSDFTLLIFLKNKPTKWVHQKMKEVIIPLYDKVPERNPNLKATLVILLANICCGFSYSDDYDWSVILEMNKWFISLERDDLDLIIERSIKLARARLPKRPRIRNKAKNKGQNEDNSNSGNKDNLDVPGTSTEKTQNSVQEGLTFEQSRREENCVDSNKINFVTSMENSKEECSESTNSNVNIDVRLDHSAHTGCENESDISDVSLSNDEDCDSVSLSISDTEL